MQIQLKKVVPRHALKIYLMRVSFLHKFNKINI